MPKVKSLTLSDVDVSFGFDTFHVDEMGFAEVSEETKRHVLSSQDSLWVDPDESPVLAQMVPVDKSNITGIIVPDPDIIRANTAGVSLNTPSPVVTDASGNVVSKVATTGSPPTTFTPRKSAGSAEAANKEGGE